MKFFKASLLTLASSLALVACSDLAVDEPVKDNFPEGWTDAGYVQANPDLANLNIADQIKISNTLFMLDAEGRGIVPTQACKAIDMTTGADVSSGTIAPVAAWALDTNAWLKYTTGDTILTNPRACQRYNMFVFDSVAYESDTTVLLAVAKKYGGYTEEHFLTAGGTYTFARDEMKFLRRYNSYQHRDDLKNLESIKVEEEALFRQYIAYGRYEGRGFRPCTDGEVTSSPKRGGCQADDAGSYAGHLYCTDVATLTVYCVDCDAVKDVCAEVIVEEPEEEKTPESSAAAEEGETETPADPESSTAAEGETETPADPESSADAETEEPGEPAEEA